MLIGPAKRKVGKADRMNRMNPMKAPFCFDINANTANQEKRIIAVDPMVLTFQVETLRCACFGI